MPFIYRHGSNDRPRFTTVSASGFNYFNLFSQVTMLDFFFKLLQQMFATFLLAFTSATNIQHAFR